MEKYTKSKRNGLKQLIF